MKINGLTSRLIDRKAIKERGEVAQGCQAVGQSNRRLMHTWLQGLRRGIRSLLSSARRSDGSPNDLVRLAHREGSDLLRSIPVQAKSVSTSIRFRKTSAKRKIASIILGQGAAKHRYILGGYHLACTARAKTVRPGQMSGRKNKTCRVGTDAGE